MLQLPETDPRRKAVAADPIFRMIASHKAAVTASNNAYSAHDEAEFNAAERLGKHRPQPLISWRGYSIGRSEIERRRIALLEGGLDAATIEVEYKDAVRRYNQQVSAGNAWDKRAGIADLIRQREQAQAAERRSAKRLSATAPTTPEGAAALLQFILDDDLEPDADYWHLPAIKTLIDALQAMG